MTGQRWDSFERWQFLVHVLECGHTVGTFLRRDLYPTDDHPLIARELRAKWRACHRCYTESVT